MWNSVNLVHWLQMQPSSQFSHPQVAGAPCPRHPETPAVDICSRCGSFVCAKCRHVTSDWLIYCLSCAPEEKVPVDMTRILVALSTLGAALLLNIGRC